MLFRSLSEDALRALAEKLRELLAQSPLRREHDPVQVTVSIGATLFQRGDTPASLVDRADTLLYASKQADRNRVTVG